MRFWQALIVAVVAASVAAEDAIERAAPWWEALREDAFWRQCQSSCTEFSKGTRTNVELCDDTAVCRGRKVSFDDYASQKCGEWAEGGRVPDVPIKDEGRRFKHEPSKGSWISCAVFCRTQRGHWYSPRGELGRQAFFPDGTWCHRDSDGEDYYCQKSLCLPERHQVEDVVRAAQESMFDLPGAFFDDNEVAIDTL